MYKGVVSLKVIGMAFLSTFAFCFFISIFVNSQIRNKNGEYYINRGYPIAWAGVISSKLKVEVPIIKAPFIKIREETDDYNKIIDLQILIPMFLVMMIPNYGLSYIFVRAVDENRKLGVFLKIYFFVLLVGCIYFYFFWFPRI